MNLFMIFWATAMSLLVACSCVMNFMLVAYIVSRQSRFGFKEVITVSMSLSDAIRCLAGYSVEFVMSFLGKSESDTMCQPLGFIISFFSYTALYHLTVLTAERYVKIAQLSLPSAVNCTTKLQAVSAVTVCWLFALLFSILPFFGVGAYGKEGITHCSVQWNQSGSSNTAVYVILLLLFCFTLPVTLICLSFVGVWRKLRRSRRVAVTTLHCSCESVLVKTRQKAEQRNAWTFFTMALVFLTAWTPYAIISFIETFGSGASITTTVKTILVFFAKASTVYNPLVFACFDKCFQRYIRKRMLCSRNNSVGPVLHGFTKQPKNCTAR
eukprot:gene7722-8561_t